MQCGIPKFLNNETKVIGTLGYGALGAVQKVLYNSEKKVAKVLKCNDCDLSRKKFIKKPKLWENWNTTMWQQLKKYV